MRRAVHCLAAFALCAGCSAWAPADAPVRRARLVAERRNLDAAFDRLEERLVANQARVRFWQEMKARHESVSAVACTSMEDHAAEMAKRLLADPPRRVAARRSPLDGYRVAAAVPGAADRPGGAAPAPPGARAPAVAGAPGLETAAPVPVSHAPAPGEGSPGVHAAP